jgi:hypothetical protein
MREEIPRRFIFEDMHQALLWMMSNKDKALEFRDIESYDYLCHSMFGNIIEFHKFEYEDEDNLSEEVEYLSYEEFIERFNKIGERLEAIV